MKQPLNSVSDASKTSGEETQLNWPTILELGVPADYRGIRNCPEATVQAALARLATACNGELPAHHDSLGRDQRRALRAKLHFAAVLLVEQAAVVKRDKCSTLRTRREKDESYPSLATIYRWVSPLKIWLQRRCGKRHPLTQKDFQTDKRLLLLLSRENIETIVTECKSFAHFAETYCAHDQAKRAEADEKTETTATDSEGTTSPLPSSQVVLHSRSTSSKDLLADEAILLIRGKISHAAQRAIIQAVEQQADVVLLATTEARELFNQVFRKGFESK